LQKKYLWNFKMKKKNKVICIIPARKGSKGLPDKNKKHFCGKPLIGWTIEAALKVGPIDKVIVSTDCPEIADIATQYGACVPFMRPANLASDNAPTIDVLMHALDFMSSKNISYEYLILLEPTSPLRDVEDISGALAMCMDSVDKISVVSVASAENYHPRFMFYLSSKGQSTLVPYSGISPSNLRRQDILDKLYFIEGSVYVSPVSLLKEHKSFFHECTAPWFVDHYKHFEIDNHTDALVVEALMRAKMEARLR
jgi:CMP-N,N'-diacetyllegionaminic acid synthase